MSLSEIVRSLKTTPEVIESLAEGLTSSELRKRPEGEIFSFVEHVCHLRDIEREGYSARIQKILEEDRPQLADIDGLQLALDRDYNAQDVDGALKDFAEARSQNVITVGGLSATQLERSGMLEGTGPVTIGALLSMLREHDVEHVEILRRLRGKLLSPRTSVA